MISWPLKRVECFNRDGFRHFGRQPYFWPTHAYMVYVRAAEPMARVLKRVSGKISLTRARRSILSQIFKISFARPVSLYCEEHVYIYIYIYIYAHISDCVETVNELPLIPNNTASKTFLHKLGAVRSVDWMFIIGLSAWR